MHTHVDSSKLPTLMPQGGEEFGVALPHDRGNRAGVGDKLQPFAPRIGNTNARGKGSRQCAADNVGQRFFAAASGYPSGKRRVGREDTFYGLRRTYHRGYWQRAFGPGADGTMGMNREVPI